jgi:hypothetical protein
VPDFHPCHWNNTDIAIRSDHLVVPPSKESPFPAAPLGTELVWISSASDPIRIRIMQIWRRVFDIHVDVDNPNLIVCGCRLVYGVSDIRRIWIIR